MKTVKNVLLAAAVTAAIGNTGAAFAHAGIFASGQVADAADNAGLTIKADGTVVKDTSISATGFLEGTSPLVQATVGHTCGHAEPYPDETDTGIILPVGADSVILKAKTVADNASAYKTGVKSSLNTQGLDYLIDTTYPAYKAGTGGWNYLLGSVKLAGSNVNALIPSFTPQTISPLIKTESVWADAYASNEMKVADHTGALVNPSKYSLINTAVWLKSKFGQEVYGTFGFRTLLPSFPKATADKATPGRCATQLKIAVPVSQICSGATTAQLEAGAHKIMNWQLAPVAGSDWSVMGEAAKVNSPYITVNRNTVTNPLPSDCPAAAITDDATTTSTLYIAPSATATAKGLDRIYKATKVTADTCASGSAAAKANCALN